MDNLEAEDRKHSRTHAFFVIFFAMIAVCALTLILLAYGKGDILIEIFKSVALLAGGFGGGYGVAYFTR